ncbi:MAG: hypothetical protein NTV22_02745 [bacterium]|nr:hypothetical protein [bacterium]
MNTRSFNLTTLTVALAALFVWAVSNLSAIDIGGIVSRATSATKTVADQVDKASSTSTDALVKRADTELRAAERKMYSGDKTGAQQLLTSSSTLITQIEAADATRKELPTLKQKNAKLQTDLDRRLGKTAAARQPAASTQPAASAVTAPARATAAPVATTPAARATSAKLPYAARESLKNFDNLYRSVENKFGKMEEAKKGATTTPPETYAKEIKELQVELQKQLADATSVATGAGLASHPDLVAAQAKLDAIPGRLQQTSASVAAVQTARTATSAGIAADAEQLANEYKRLRESTFDKAGGAAVYYNDLGPVTNLLAVIVAFENNELETTKKMLADFHVKYGETEEDIRASTDDSAAARDCRNLEEGIANVAKTRITMAEDLAERIDQRLTGLADAHDFYRLARHDEVRAWLAVAQQYDKTNAKVAALTQRCDKALADDLQQIKAKIAARKWPAHAANAPADAKKLAATALDWFKNSTDWGKREQNDRATDKQPRVPLAVAVTGPWSIQERNIVGEPTMYGLPILLAVQLPADGKDGLARVFVLTMRTAEFKGVKMEPPFDSVTVGDSYFINADAVQP